jgi:hypothetical protein
VVHLFDQGFAGGLWLGLLVALGLRFVLSFRKDYQLIDAEAQQAQSLAYRARQARFPRALALG